MNDIAVTCEPALPAMCSEEWGRSPVTSAIQGDVRLPAHGSKEMPVWGVPFWSLSQGHSSEVQLRVTNLSKYIESLQEK
jgi:hypothetical protein